MAVNKLLPFANGVGSNVVDYDTWSALTQVLGNGFVTGVARSDYANRLFSQGALASYILGEFVVEQTAQDADLDESVFYTNFKNALVSYIKTNAVSLDTAQTVGGVKTFTSIPLVPTADAGDNSQKVATTAFVQGEIASKANDSDVVKLTGSQTIAGTKTFSDSPEVPTPASGDNSQKTASTGFVQNAISSQSVKFDSGQTLTDAQKAQARSNIGAPDDSDVVKIVAQSLTDAQKTQACENIGTINRADMKVGYQYAYYAFAPADNDEHKVAEVTLDTSIASKWLCIGFIYTSFADNSASMNCKVMANDSITVANNARTPGTNGGGVYTTGVLDTTGMNTATVAVYGYVNHTGGYMRGSIQVIPLV